MSESSVAPTACAASRESWLCGEGVAVPTEAEAEDAVALEQLLHRLCAILAEGPDEALAAMLLPGAVLVTDRRRLDEEVHGLVAIRAWHADELSRQRSAGGHHRLTAIVPIVRIDGDEAEILAYSTAEHGPGAGGVVEVVMGRLELALRRTSGGWRIARLLELRFFSYGAGAAADPAELEFP
jgi:hypothetical protein